MATESAQEKAARLLREGCVEPASSPVQHFQVHGDTSTHDVFIGPHVRVCLSCPAWDHHGDCSHIQAALEWVFAQGDRVAPLGDGGERARRYETALATRRAQQQEKVGAHG